MTSLEQRAQAASTLLQLGRQREEALPEVLELGRCFRQVRERDGRSRWRVPLRVVDELRLDAFRFRQLVRRAVARHERLVRDCHPAQVKAARGWTK